MSHENGAIANVWIHPNGDDGEISPASCRGGHNIIDLKIGFCCDLFSDKCMWKTLNKFFLFAIVYLIEAQKGVAWFLFIYIYHICICIYYNLYIYIYIHTVDTYIVCIYNIICIYYVCTYSWVYYITTIVWQNYIGPGRGFWQKT